jgi:hypothetical protein
MPILFDRSRGDVCPECHLDYGRAIEQKTEDGAITVTYKCPLRTRTWTRSEPNVDA